MDQSVCRVVGVMKDHSRLVIWEGSKRTAEIVFRIMSTRKDRFHEIRLETSDEGETSGELLATTGRPVVLSSA